MIRSFYLIALLYTVTLFASKLDSLKTVEQQSIDNGDLKKQLLVLEDMIEYHRFEGNYRESDSLIFIGIEITNDNNLPSRTADFYNLLGMNKNIISEYDKSLEAFNKALEIFTSLDDKKSMSLMMENIGITYKDMAKYPNAMEYLMSSLDLKKKNNIRARLSSVYMMISTLYNKMEDLKKQEEYIRLAYRTLREDNETSSRVLASFYNEFAAVMDDTDQMDSCIYYYNKVIEESKKVGWNRGMAAGVSNLAEIYYELEDYQKALELHYQALELEEKIDNKYGICYEYMFIGRLLEKIDHDKNINSAITYAKKALDISLEYELYNEAEQALQLLSEYYISLNNYKEAVHTLKETSRIRDTLSMQESRKVFAELEGKYQNEIKTKQIEILHSENRFKQIKINIVIGLSIVIIVFSLLLFGYQKKKSTLEKNDIEQKLLRSQMNPHFIFNALGAIQNYILRNDAKKASDYLNNFSLLSRSVLINSNKDAIPLNEEIDMLKNYIELEKLRMNNSFSYEMSIECDGEEELINIPPMLIQPFIENAIKHGFKIDKPGKKLIISFTAGESDVKVRINDNGIGYNRSTSQRISGHKSMAMAIFKQRNNLLEKKYRSSLKYRITDLSENGGEGTEVLITLPILEI
ncbi:MAG: histidine kinase [Candidatus Delongbacteria bacterium]|nr:histidine kinase [Candidatus Delongbacteria bacterium]MBN2834959.1 histidine kinase [Candidatus Delongbacteria bacterium]